MDLRSILSKNKGYATENLIQFDLKSHHLVVQKPQIFAILCEMVLYLHKKVAELENKKLAI